MLLYMLKTPRPQEGSFVDHDLPVLPPRGKNHRLVDRAQIAVNVPLVKSDRAAHLVVGDQAAIDQPAACSF